MNTQARHPCAWLGRGFAASWLGLLLGAGAGLAAAGPAARPVTPAAAQAPAPLPGLQRSVRAYTIPSLRVQGADGVKRELRDALSDGRPVVMTFMYASCATVCPIINQTMVAFEQLLAAEGTTANTVSISIDPDHDSVRQLADLARRTGARGSFYTSDPATSEAVQRAFDAWRGDKMNHQPVFLLSKRPQQPQWVRLDGLVTPRQLLDEYHRLLASAS